MCVCLPIFECALRDVTHNRNITCVLKTKKGFPKKDLSKPLTFMFESWYLAGRAFYRTQVKLLFFWEDGNINS